MSEQDNLPTTVEALTAAVERGRSEFYAALDGLTAEQLAAPLTDRDWSVADHMAHIAVWMEGILAALDGTNRWQVMGGGPPSGGDFDELNERLRAPHAKQSPAEARAWLDATHERMLARLRSMTIEELHRPYNYYQPGETRNDGDQPFLHWVVGDTYGHYDEHRGWITAAMRQRGWA